MNSVNIPPHPSTVLPVFPRQILPKVQPNQAELPNNYSSVMTPLPDAPNTNDAQGSAG